jgi:protein-disulfide isomerase
MPSQKASKRRRQAARTPPPPSARSAKARTGRPSPRVLIIAGVVAVAIIVAIVLGVVLTGGSKSSSNTPAAKLPQASDVGSLLAGIPQNGNVLGKPSAPLTLIQYVDLQCPYCRQFETEAMPTLIKRYVRPGKLKIESRVVAILGPDSQRGRQAAVAAGQQNKMFDFAQLVYDNQGTENTGWLDDSLIKSAAASVGGLNVSRLESDKGSSSVSDRLQTFDQQAKEAGINGTPTIYLVHKGGTPKLITLSAPNDPSAIESAIATS